MIEPRRGDLPERGHLPATARRLYRRVCAPGRAVARSRGPEPGRASYLLPAPETPDNRRKTLLPKKAVPTFWVACGAWVLGVHPAAASQTAPDQAKVEAPPAAVETLPAIVITSTRLDASLLETPASVSLVDGEAMRNARPRINLSESLGGVPGLQIQNRENYAQDLQLSMRGYGARSTFGVRGVRLYVDGIPATMPDGQGQTSNIDIGSIDHVEVLRGPFSALYGNSSGGVVQIFTEEGKAPPELSSSFAAGSQGVRRYSMKARGLTTTGTGDLDYVLSVNRFTTDGYREHSAARRTQGNARLGLQLDDDTRLTLLANTVSVRADDPLGLDRARFEDDPRSAVDNATLYNTRKSVDQTQGGLIYEKRLPGGDQLRAMVYYGERDMVQYQAIPVAAQRSPQHSGGVIDLSRRYAGADLRWTRQLRLADRPLTLVTGVAYDELREDRRGYENFVGEQLGVKGALRRNENNKVWNLDPYLQASWALTESWTLDAGLRYSRIRFRSEDHYVEPGNADDSGKATYREWLPVGSLRWTPTSDLTFYVSAGKGFETPTFNELSYRNDGLGGLNFALRPATNVNVEVGAKARLAGGVLTAALYQSRTRDEIVAADASFGRTTYQNAGRTRRSGFELAWDGTLVGHLKAQLAYGWLDARYRDDCATTSCLDASRPDKQLRAGNRLPGVARHAFYMSLDWLPEEGFRAGVDGRFLSRIPVNDGNTEWTPSYFVSGVHAGYVWKRGDWRLASYARIDNLFNRQYAGAVIVNEGNQRYYEPAVGRSWSAGLDLTYTF